MVILKGMEPQTDCQKCPLMATDGTDTLSPMICMALWATKHEVKHCIQGRILDDCPLVEIVTCKDCEYWNKETEYCKHWMGRTEDAYYTVHTGADFYCEDAKVRK